MTELAQQRAPSPPTLRPPLAAYTHLQLALLRLLDLPLDQLEVLLDIGAHRQQHLKRQEASTPPRLRVAA